MNVLILGSNGLVGSSLKRILANNQKITELIASTRKDTDLFNLDSTKKLINEHKPDVLINAAAKVGGIYANNTKRVEFILENLKINTNVLESCIPHNNIKIINLGSSCIYPLEVENPIKEESVMTGKLEPTNSPYAMAKLTAIEIGNALSQQYGHSRCSWNVCLVTNSTRPMSLTLRLIPYWNFGRITQELCISQKWQTTI